MSDATLDIGTVGPPSVLKPYAGSSDSRRRRRLKALVLPTVTLFCLLFGFLFAFLGPFMPMMFALPPVILAVLVIWALPGLRTAPTRSLTILFFAFFVALVIWPNYLAIALPGMPWITMIRLTGFPLAFILLICVSVSGPFRRHVAEIVSAVPVIWKLLVAFVAIQLLSIGLSHSPLQSVDKFILAQTGWTAIFFVSCYVFAKPGRVGLWAALLWAMAIVVGAIGVVEMREGHVPWSGHIPAFLKIDDPDVQRILAGQMRAALDQYRIQSTFTTSLGLAEYIALTAPFILQFLFGKYNIVVKIGAACSILALFYVVILTDSRLGIIGFFLAILAYGLFWGVTRWRRNPRGLAGPALTLAYPAIFALALASTFLSHRIHARVWGNGYEQASNQSRHDQWQSGLPLVLQNPIGHGVGMGARTLGYTNSDGVLTIDTYYLLILLEYGLIGFVIYYGLFVVAIYYSGKYAINDTPKTGDYAFLAPLTIALVNFVIIKSVFSNQDNHPLVFMMLGIVVALIYRLKKEVREGAPPRGQSNGAASPVQPGGPRLPSTPAAHPDRA